MNRDQTIYDLLVINDTEKSILSALSTPKSVSEIAAETGISRTGINYCLASSLSRGYIRIVRNGRRKKYLSIPINELADHIQQSLDQIRAKNGGKVHLKIQTAKDNEFVIHVGTDQIIPAFQRIAFEHKNERIRAIQHHRSYNELLEKMSAIQLVDFNQTIIKNHLIIDGILNEGAYQTYKEEISNNPAKYKASVKSLEGRMADYTYFADNYFDQNAEIWIFKNTTLIINWHEEVAIEITNVSMTAFLRDMFEFVKKDCVKIDHNRAMRTILGANETHR